jgi:hypothetical protein
MISSIFSLEVIEDEYYQPDIIIFASRQVQIEEIWPDLLTVYLDNSDISTIRSCSNERMNTLHFRISENDEIQELFESILHFLCLLRYFV